MIPQSVTTSSPSDTESPSATNPVAFSVVTGVFFMWGFITALNDILVPHLKSLFALNYAQTMLIQFCFFGAYLVMSLPAGRVVSSLGYKSSMVIGLCVAGAGALLFYPAAALPAYPVFLGALFVLATGITLLQVAANPYVSLLGPERTAASRLNLSQAVNSLGHVLGPLFGGLLILSGSTLVVSELAKLPAAAQTAYHLQQAHAVQGPYLAIGAALFLLAVTVYLFHLPNLDDRAGNAARAPRHPIGATLRYPQVLLGVVAIFLYVGAEVSIGSFLASYVADPAIGNVPIDKAARFVSYYMLCAMFGRFCGSALLQKIAARTLLSVFAALAAGLLLTTMVSHGSVAVWSVVAIGAFNSIMFPTIFTLSIEKMGSHTGRASSLLVMAIVGGAVIPELQGILADALGSVQHAFILPLLCYLYIACYGLIGSKHVRAAA
jgi:FHS family L-fucose permease-like MFS transporter